MNHTKQRVYNADIQDYKGVKLRLIVYTDAHFAALKAKRFLLCGENTSQNVWIPNRYLEPDGTIKAGANIDFVFIKAFNQNKFRLAGIPINPYDWAIARVRKNMDQQK